MKNLKNHSLNIIASAQKMKIEGLTFDSVEQAKDEAMKLAKRIYKDRRDASQLNNSWFLCLKAAWNIVKLKTAAKKGIIYFSFRRVTNDFLQGKKVGDLRFAMATLNADFMNYEFKGGQPTYTNLQFRFYDTMLGRWRSCRVETIVDVFWASEAE